MSLPNMISIDGQDYVPADGVKTGNISLCVLERGFIFVGVVVTTKTGIEISSVRNVRKWKSGGIGGLSKGAKSSGAVLDDAMDMIVPSKSILFIQPLPEDWDV